MSERAHTHCQYFVGTFSLFPCQLKNVLFNERQKNFLFNEIQKTTEKNVKFTCIPRLTNINTLSILI